MQTRTPPWCRTSQPAAQWLVRPLIRGLWLKQPELREGFSNSSMVRKPPAAQESQVRSLGWEDPLEKEMATHSSILAWRIPWREETWRATEEAFSLKWNRIARWPNNYTPQFIPESKEDKCPHGSLYTKAESSVIHESPKVETPQCSLADEWINRKYYVQKMEHCLATEWNDMLAYYSRTTPKTQSSVKEARHRWPRIV